MIQVYTFHEAILALIVCTALWYFLSYSLKLFPLSILVKTLDWVMTHGVNICPQKLEHKVGCVWDEVRQRHLESSQYSG